MLILKKKHLCHQALFLSFHCELARFSYTLRSVFIFCFHPFCFFPLFICRCWFLEFQHSYLQHIIKEQRRGLTWKPFHIISMFTRTMFPPPPSREDELKASHFTALSLSTDIQASQQSYIPPQVANKLQSTGFPYTRNNAGPMKVKRKRCLDGAELTIGIGSSSNLFKTQGVDHPTELVSCVSLGGDYSQKQPAPTAAVSGFVKTSEKRVFDEASPCHHQFVQGVRGGNANKESDDRRYVNDPIRACLYQQYGRGISCENDGKMNTHPRSRKTSGKTSISDKIQHRMIKNRESAARSRARKQALEAQQLVENTELKKENDLLKRVVRFLLAILRTKRMKLPALSRSFSAPL